MGHKWEVWTWDANLMEYTQAYAGKSAVRAILYAIHMKRYYGCVKIEWR